MRRAARRTLEIAGAVWLAGVVSPVVAAQERLPATGGDIVMTALAHASVQIEHGQTVVQLDPWSGADLSAAKRADLILITDADDGAHHLDPKGLAMVRKDGAPVVIPATGRPQVPDGVVLNNGESRSFGAIRVEAVGAYDLKPGEPYHPKGEANGYVITLAGKRLFIAGVTECVPEIQALRNIDVAFMPMNLPQGRMPPQAVADCLATFKPAVVIPYHHDQGYLARKAGRPSPITAAAMAETVRTLEQLMAGKGVQVRELAFYPGPAGHPAR